MAWGRKLSPGSMVPQETMLVELNRRGRALTLKSRPAKAGEKPVALIAGQGGKGYIASSNITAGKNNERQQVRLSWYDEKADFRSEKILRDDVFDYSSEALIPAIGGNGFIALIHAVNHRNDKDRNAVLLRYARDGSLLWRRSYRPGAANQLRGLTVLPDNTYLATGMIQMGDGRMAGWALNLSADGSIIWQRTYPRGASAVLNNAVTMVHTIPGSNMIVALGGVSGTDGGSDAAWVLAMDISGEPLWQRYIRRPDYALTGFGIGLEDQYRLTLALNAEGIDESDAEPRRDHVRLFTMTSNGVLIGDEAYIDGIEAEGAQLLRGKDGERIIVGTIQSDIRPLNPSEQLAEALKIDSADPENQPAAPKPDEIEQEGWVFVATALEPYDDPCLKQGSTP
jgi:hypothetical protein